MKALWNPISTWILSIPYTIGSSVKNSEERIYYSIGNPMGARRYRELINLRAQVVSLLTAPRCSKGVTFKIKWISLYTRVSSQRTWSDTQFTYYYPYYFWFWWVYIFFFSVIGKYERGLSGWALFLSGDSFSNLDKIDMMSGIMGSPMGCGVWLRLLLFFLYEVYT